MLEFSKEEKMELEDDSDSYEIKAAEKELNEAKNQEF
jgi:hypothetical protein